MSELTITNANFDAEVLQSPVPVFVDFWAVWCGPCQMTSPIVEELSHEYDASKVKIGKINVDDNQELAGKYQILSIPSFLLFKGGEVVDQIVGGVSKERLKAMIDKYI